MRYFKNKNKILGNHNSISKNSGFTLIETMVAIFVLTVSLSALLNLTADSTLNARYARNEITANYLMQEVVDRVKNDRDSIVFHSLDAGTNWITFKNNYSECFGGKTCQFEARDIGIYPTACDGDSCPKFYYDEEATSGRFYTYSTVPGVETSFIRKIKMYTNGEDEIGMVVTVEWLNGSITRSRSLSSSLLNWQK